MKKDFICPECNKPRKNARMDAKVCSSNCRVKKLRRINKEEREANSPLNKMFTGKNEALNKLTIK